MSENNKTDLKQWIVVILFINLIFLPLMWLRKQNATPTVLGANEQSNGQLVASENTTTKSKGKTEPEAQTFNLTEWLSNNLGFSNSRFSSSEKARTVEGEIINSQLPERSRAYKSLTDVVENITLVGKIKQIPSLKSDLSIRDLQIGDKVELSCDGKTLSTIVDGAFIGTKDEIGAASSDTFKRLGIDPTQTTEISCTVRQI